MSDDVIRVLYVGHTAALSGGELALARLLPNLHDVDATVVLAADGPLVDRLRTEGIRCIVLPMSQRTATLGRDRVQVGRLPLRAVVDSIRYSWGLRSFIRRSRFDLVHTNTLKASIYGGVAGRLAGVPVVWHTRDRIADDYLPRMAVVVLRLLARILPTAIIVNSRATASASFPGVASEGGEPPPHRLFVVHDAASSGDRHGEPRTARPFTVGLVGRLAPWKGQDVFLRAFARAFPAGEERARIVGAALFGEDDWAASLPLLAESLGIADRVDFVGFVDDVDSEYAVLDLLVHASTVPEPFGQVVVEAMAAGVPVLATDAGGPAEIVTDGVDGLLTPMGDVDALAAAMVRLAGDDELRGSLARAGLVRARDFAPERVAAKVMDVYRSVLARPRRGRRSMVAQGRRMPPPSTDTV